MSSPQSTSSNSSPVTTQADSMLANLQNNNNGVVKIPASVRLEICTYPCKASDEDCAHIVAAYCLQNV